MPLRAVGNTGLTVPAVGMGIWRTWHGGYVDINQIHNVVVPSSRAAPENVAEHLPLLEALRDVGHIGIIRAKHYCHEAFPELAQ